MRAVREGHRDEMIAHVVTRADASLHAAIGAAAEARLRERLGLRIRVEVAAPGALDSWTEIHTAPKPKRFRDERSAGKR